MPRLIWSEASLKDIKRLHKFLSIKSPGTAQKAVRTIRQTVKIIAQQPEIGRPVEGMNPEYREWLIDFGSSGYVALYHYDGKTAVILAVKHQREVGYPDR